MNQFYITKFTTIFTLICYTIQLNICLTINNIIMNKRHTILFAAIGLSGHLNPILAIAQYLSLRNYQILIATSACILKRIQKRFTNAKILIIEDELHKHLDEWLSTTVPFQDCCRFWMQPLKKFVDNHKIDLIISDFGCLAALKIAKSHQIKLIINLPGPIQIYNQCCNYPNFQSAWTIAGFTIITPKLPPTIIQYIFPFFKVIADAMQQSIIFCNSFIGFEKNTIVLPPNVKFTGALVNQQKPVQIEEDLKQWLMYVRQQKLDIIYVSFGSMLGLTQYFIEKLYYDLKQTGKAVLWSMPLNKNTIPQKNQKFYVQNWLPQTQLFKLPEVKIFLTHCGWNSVIECISSQIPMLCCPVFADQGSNTQLVVNAGIGIILRPQKKFLKKKPVDNPTWTRSELLQKINQLINNKKYSEKLKLFKGLLGETGGFETVQQTIQNYLKNGNQHLIDKSLNRIRRTSIFDTLKFLILTIIIGIVIHYI